MQKRSIQGVRRLRRKLLCAALFCLGGAYTAQLWEGLYGLGFLFCTLFALIGIFRASRGRWGALFCAMAAMFCLGLGLTGHALSLPDRPTRPGTAISGRVQRIVSERRVILEDVTVEENGRLRHPAAVTLMLEEGELRDSVLVGQIIEGTGRLFAQEGIRNPGGIDRRIQALSDGYELSGYILPGWTACGKARFSPGELFRVAREAVLELMGRVFGEDAALYQAVLLGERGGMEADVVRSMRLTGTAHILTVSGLHLSLLAAWLDALLRRLTDRRLLRAGVKGTLLALFAGLTGGAPGTVRALIMALMRDLATLRGRRYDPMTALAAAALLMTLVNPVWPLDGSFQFLFLVVLGILLIGGRVNAMLAGICPQKARKRLRPVIGAVSVSTSAQVAALPMQLLFYGYVPLLAFPMNLIAGALTPVLMGIGALCTAAGAVSLRAGTAMAGVLALPGRLFEQMSVSLATQEGGILRLPAPYAAWVLLAAACMALCSTQIVWSRHVKRIRPCALALLLVLYLPRFCPAARYVQLDVGQGDAALLRSGRSTVLVDVGPADRYDVLRYLRHEGLTVELVVLSHLDEDHAGALGTLLASEVKIGGIVMPAGATEDVNSETVIAALALARAEGVPVAQLQRGDSFDAAGAHFDVLSPNETLTGSNERSLLLYTQAQGVRLMLTGDLPANSEPETVPDCDVLKVAHHGSKYATSETFLEQATPRLALISVGAGNSYGHPTQHVLDALDSAGAQVYRTDESGCVTVWLRGGTWHAQPFIN